MELEDGRVAVVTQSRSRAPHAPCVRLVSGSGPDTVFASEEMDLEQCTLQGSKPPCIARALSSGGLSEVGKTQMGADAEEREFETRVEDGTLLASEG